MAITYEITVHIKANGRAVQGFPLTRRITCVRNMDLIREHADEGDVQLDANYLLAWESGENVVQVNAPEFFYISADQTIRVQSKYGDAVAIDTYPIVLAPDGFILAVGLDTTGTVPASGGTSQNSVTNSGMAVCNYGANSVERIIVGGDA